MIYSGIGPPRSKLAQDKESAWKGGVHRLRLACRQSLDAIAPGAPAAGRPRHLYDGALLGMAAVLLLDSLMGHKYSVLAFTAVAAMSAWYGRGTRLLVVTLAALMATDSLLPPGRPQDPATLAVLVRSAIFILDGALIGSLFLAFHATEQPAGMGVPKGSHPQGASHQREEHLRLLLESSHQSKERFRLLVTGIKDYGIFMLDPEGRVVSWSAGAERNLGYRTGEILGRHFSSFSPPEDLRRDRPRSELAAAAAQARFEGEGWRLRKDGTQIWAHVGITALRDDVGSLLGFATVMRDISGRKQAEEELRRARDELEIRVGERTAELTEANQALQAEIAERMRAEEAAKSASRAKDRFLAMLSHELRTPLTPVLATVTSVLDETTTAADVRSIMEMIRRSIELEARLIDDLLDVTRVMHGKLRLDRKVVDVHAVLHQTLSICQGDLCSKRMQWELDLAASEFHAHADQARLQQVFWNLIKNAVKFTPAGGTITIRSRNEGRADSGARLVVEVIDSGIGIAPELLPRIFDAFEQGEDAVTRKFGGLGLGLAISHSIVEAHAGRLSATSSGRDRGTTFTVELAAQAAPARPEREGAPTRGHVPPKRGLKILLVEDDLPSLRVLTRLLQQRRHEVTAVDTMAAALEIGRKEEFDLLISDIGLPDGNGWELMRRLQERRPTRGIALTGFGMDDDVRKTREAGFMMHLTKPIDSRNLDAVIMQMATSPDRVEAALLPQSA